MFYDPGLPLQATKTVMDLMRTKQPLNTPRLKAKKKTLLFQLSCWILFLSFFQS